MKMIQKLRCLVATISAFSTCAIQLTMSNKRPFVNFTEKETTLPPPAGPLRHGLAFVHVPKAGGTTFEGVLRRLAFKNGVRGAKVENPLASHTQPPFVFTPGHSSGITFRASFPQKLDAMNYVTIVRDPVEMAFSKYNYRAAMGKSPHGALNQVSDVAQLEGFKFDFSKSDLINYLKHDHLAYTQTEYIQRKGENAYKSNSSSSFTSSFNAYKFVAVMDRFDESSLILARLLEAKMNDVLYMPTNLAGSECTHLAGQPLQAYKKAKDQPPEVKDAAEYVRKGSDEAVFQMANKRLDALIKSYPGFHHDLAVYKERLATIAEQCGPCPKEETCLRASADGYNSGCGQPCIDDLIQERNWT